MPNFKILGFAVVAVLAMSALAASTAQAAEGTFSWKEGTARLTATQEPETNGGSQLFKITNKSLSVTCNEVHATVKLPEGKTTATELETSEITYTDASKEADHCRGPLSTSPKSNMNGCQYKFHAGEIIKEGETKGTVDLNCPEGKEVTVESAACTVHIPAQSGLSSVSYRAVAGSPGDVTLEPNVTGIKYKHTGLCGNGEGSDGIYTGNVTVKQDGTFSWKEGTARLTATQEPETNGGSQLFKITNKSLSVTCNEVHATVKLPEGKTTATELETSEITYTDSTKEADHCRGPLSTSPKINMNGCQYKFHAGEIIKEGETKGTVDLNCPEGKEVTVESAACTVHIPAQSGLSSVTYKTIAGPPEDFTVEPNVTGIKYKHTGLCGNGEGSDGTYTGNVTVKAEDNVQGQKDVRVT